MISIEKKYTSIKLYFNNPHILLISKNILNLFKLFKDNSFLFQFLLLKPHITFMFKQFEKA